VRLLRLRLLRLHLRLAATRRPLALRQQSDRRGLCTALLLTLAPPLRGRRQAELVGGSCRHRPTRTCTLPCPAPPQAAADAAADIQKLQGAILTDDNVKALRQSVLTLCRTLEHVESISSDVSVFSQDASVQRNLKTLIQALSRLVEE
jgi:hypothetical protein